MTSRLPETEKRPERSREMPPGRTTPSPGSTIGPTVSGEPLRWVGTKLVAERRMRPGDFARSSSPSEQRRAFGELDVEHGMGLSEREASLEVGIDDKSSVAGALAAGAADAPDADGWGCATSTSTPAATTPTV